MMDFPNLRRVLLALLVASMVSACATHPSLQNGDIVFQDSAMLSSQSEAIKALTRSEWSHCGIVFRRPGGRVVVVDGNGIEGPVPWSVWNQRGGGKFALYRFINPLTLHQQRDLYRAALSYDGRPYDRKFAWDDETIYCSELIWKACRNALGVQVGGLQTYRDFDLGSPAARWLIGQEGSWQDPAAVARRRDMKVISPQMVLESPLLVRVPR